MGSPSIYHSHSLYSPPLFLHKHLTNSHTWTSIYTTPPFIHTAAFFFFISGLIPQLMNFNRPQSEHLSSVFLSPKVMDLNHLRVLRQLCVRRAKEVRMKWGGEEGWMIRADGMWMNKRATEGWRGKRTCLPSNRWLRVGCQRETNWARGEWPWLQNGFLLDVNTYVCMRAISHINTCASINTHSHTLNESLIVSGLPFSWSPPHTHTHHPPLITICADKWACLVMQRHTQWKRGREMLCFCWLGVSLFFLDSHPVFRP